MTVLLVGGNKGIGKAVKDELLETVITVGRTDCDYKLDLTWPDKHIKAVVRDAVRDKYIDCVVVSSGEGAYFSPLISEAKRDKLFKVNVFGPLAIYKYTLPKLMQTKGKCIMITSTAARKPGSSGLALYAATKAAINGWVISEARRAIEHDVGLCAIAPGWVDTEMTENIHPRLKEAIVRSIPAKRMATPSEIARFIYHIYKCPNWTIAGIILECSGGA